MWGEKVDKLKLSLMGVPKEWRELFSCLTPYRKKADVKTFMMMMRNKIKSYVNADARGNEASFRLVI